MKTPCRRTLDGVGTQQISVTATIEASPALELAAGRMLILVMEEMRHCGVVVRQLRIALDGDDLSADHVGPSW